MTNAFLQLLIILLLQDHAYVSANMNFTISPVSPLRMTTTEASTGKQMTLNCAGPASGIIAIGIYAIWSGGVNQSLLAIVSRESHNATKFPASPPDSIVSGTLATRHLTLIFPSAKCGDTGSYRCNVTYLHKQALFHLSMQENYVVEVLPGMQTIHASYSGSSNDQGFVLPDTLTMDCGGSVGTIYNATQISWVWRYRDKATTNFTVYEQPSAISPLPNRTSKPDACYEERYNRLVRALNLSDERQEYQCTLTRDGIEFPAAAATYMLGSVRTEGGDTPTTQSDIRPNDQTKPTNETNVVAKSMTSEIIVGAAVGVGTLAFTIVVCFVCMQKSSHKPPPDVEPQFTNFPVDVENQMDSVNPLPIQQMMFIPEESTSYLESSMSSFACEESEVDDSRN